MSQELTAEGKVQRITVSFFIRLFLPFALAFFMSCLLRTINNVLSPTFIETFKMSATDLGTMTSAYFLSFAIAQIPLGIFLDKYNAGRTLSVFLIFGILGCVVFSQAPTIFWLFVGRALVGIGVSGCMMGAYKAFGDWIPKEKLPVFNSLQSFVGGVGGMVATSPIKYALGFMDWRTLFLVLAGLTALVALILLVSPKHPMQMQKTKGLRFLDELKGTGKLVLTARFWRLAPVAVLGQATYLALNSLWIGPWFRDVLGVPKDAVPNYLLICAFAITIGYLANGFIAAFVKARFGKRVFDVSVTAMALYAVVLLLIVLFPQAGKVLWPIFIFLGPFSLLTYPIFSDMYDYSLSGRVQTLYNMLVFVMSTVIQSGIGMIIDLYERVNGSYNPQGYSAALIVIVVLLAFSVVWALTYRKNKNEIKL
ncbi:MAG: MFS transporter [Bacillota bacterium]